MVNVVVAAAWSKKAQVPPQTVAPLKGVVGAGDTVNELVKALGAPVAGTCVAVTVVFAANSPVPEEGKIAILVAGVVTAGVLSVERRYIVAFGVPAKTAALATIVAAPPLRT